MDSLRLALYLSVIACCHMCSGCLNLEDWRATITSPDGSSQTISCSNLTADTYLDAIWATTVETITIFQLASSSDAIGAGDASTGLTDSYAQQDRDFGLAMGNLSNQCSLASSLTDKTAAEVSVLPLWCTHSRDLKS